MQRANPNEGKYIIKIIIGKLRLGFGDQFLLEEFSIAFVGDKKYLGKIKESYSICTDIGSLQKLLSNMAPRLLDIFP